MNPDIRSHVHELIDYLPRKQLAAIETLLESIIDDEELTEEDRRALRASDGLLPEWSGIPFDQVAAELGFTMEQILGDGHSSGHSTASPC